MDPSLCTKENRRTDLLGSVGWPNSVTDPKFLFVPLQWIPELVNQLEFNQERVKVNWFEYLFSCKPFVHLYIASVRVTRQITPAALLLRHIFESFIFSLCAKCWLETTASLKTSTSGIQLAYGLLKQSAYESLKLGKTNLSKRSLPLEEPCDELLVEKGKGWTLWFN